jgi:hypothetical protein
MISRLLLAMVLVATFGLSACDKSEEAAPAQKAAESGAAEQTTEGAKEGAKKASE